MLGRDDQPLGGAGPGPVGHQGVGGAGLVDHLDGQPGEQVGVGRGEPLGVEGWASVRVRGHDH